MASSGTTRRARTDDTTGTGDTDTTETDVTPDTVPATGVAVVTDADPAPGDTPAAPSASGSGGGGGSATSYLNTSGDWLVYDAEGHGVDADAWTPEVTLDRIGRQHRDNGFLRSRTSLGLT